MPTPEMKTGTAEGKQLSDCFPGGVLGETLLCVRSVGLTFRVSFALTTEDIISPDSSLSEGDKSSSSPTYSTEGNTTWRNT